MRGTGWAVRGSAAAVAALAALAATPAHAGGPDAPVTVHGDLQASAYWWQQSSVDCAPMAARVLVAAKTGVVASETAVTAVAAEVAGYGPNGTDWSKMTSLLAAFGVPAHNVAIEASSGPLQALREALDRSGPVAVAINAAPVWDTVLKGYAYPDPSWHAVVVERIDDVAHTVTLVDSATAEGRQETVPAATFAYAFEQAGSQAVALGAGA